MGNANVKIADETLCRDTILKICSQTKEDLCVAYMDVPEERYR